MENLLTNRSLNLKSGQILLKCYMYSIFLYGCAVATYTVKTINYLEACEIRFHRKMSGIPWIKKISNRWVLEMASTERSILDTIKKRRIGYFGRVLRAPKYELIKLIIRGKIEGWHRVPGRKKILWLRNVRQWIGLKTVQELMRVAEEWEIWNKKRSHKKSKN